MDEQMIDVVSFTDDDGKQFEMEIIDEFEYDGNTYAVLADLEEDDECDCGECVSDADSEAKDCGCGDEGEAACACGCADGEGDDDDSLYIMKVVKNGDEEEFVPVEDELLEVLIPIVEERLFSEEDPT